jgi:hypothetical protein
VEHRRGGISTILEPYPEILAMYWVGDRFNGAITRYDNCLEVGMMTLIDTGRYLNTAILATSHYKVSLMRLPPTKRGGAWLKTIPEFGFVSTPFRTTSGRQRSSGNGKVY